MVAIPLTKPGEELRDVGLGHRREGGVAGPGEMVGVPAEVSAVRRDRVGGDTPLDGEVIEIGPGRSAELVAPGRCAVRRQRKTSSTGTQDMPCASATWS